MCGNIQLRNLKYRLSRHKSYSFYYRIRKSNRFYIMDQKQFDSIIENKKYNFQDESQIVFAVLQNDNRPFPIIELIFHSATLSANCIFNMTSLSARRFLFVPPFLFEIFHHLLHDGSFFSFSFHLFFLRCRWLKKRIHLSRHAKKRVRLHIPRKAHILVVLHRAFLWF